MTAADLTARYHPPVSSEEVPRAWVCGVCHVTQPCTQPAPLEREVRALNPDASTEPPYATTTTTERTA